ncbi:MAG: hypothetical protein SOY04_15145 [Clostridium celatum]|nr:hypothetical protein [Clostridium celatum]
MNNYLEKTLLLGGWSVFFIFVSKRSLKTFKREFRCRRIKNAVY